jgi:hypothetical protein
MVGRTTRVERAASNSNVDTASFTSSSITLLPDSEDEDYQPSVPPITGTNSHYFYGPSDATTSALGGMYDDAYSIILPEQLSELMPGGIVSSTRSLPSTITPPLLQPTLQEFVSPHENADGRYSAAAQGKGKALTEDQYFLVNIQLILAQWTMKMYYIHYPIFL